MSDNTLILRLRKGDKKALAEIYSEYRASFIAWITHSHKCTEEEAIDIFQYTILSFYENVVKGSFENVNSAGIKTYLYSIGKNRLLSDNRKKMRVSYKESLEDYEQANPTEEDIQFIRSQKIEKITQALNELGDPCKEVLQLFYYNNLTIDEIAEVMGYKNAGTVRNIKYKCIQRIRKYLEQY